MLHRSRKGALLSGFARTGLALLVTPFFIPQLVFGQSAGANKIGE